MDVIIADFMSEYNMTSAAGKRVDAQSQPTSGGKGDATAAYDMSFLVALEPALEHLARNRVKLAVNAGVADTAALYEVVSQMVRAKGLDLKIAWVSGDEVLQTVQTSLANGKSVFRNIYTGEELSSWGYEPIYAQSYLGGLGVAAALREGADIVLCGRVSDASPVIGAACWYHRWERSELDKLANAFVAGHLIECSTYVTGGNFSGFKALEAGNNWADIGFPIAEISFAGQVVITKQADAPGGAVTVDTCSSQLLYEIQGPWYFNSDVTAVLDGIHFEQLGLNRVAVHGVQSAPPPPTTKVGITARGGYQAEVHYYLVGLDIAAKARMIEAQIRELLAPHSDRFTALTFTTLGSAPDNPRNQDSATVTFRILAQTRRAEDLAPKNFVRLITDNIMQGYPGATFNVDLRQGFPKPVFEYYVSLLPQSDIKHRVHLPWKDRTVDIAPPPMTEEYPPRQPSQARTARPSNVKVDFGATVPGPLGWVVHARSGDKGPDANCGFWVRHRDEYAWLRTVLSTETIKELLGPEYRANPALSVERFELSELRGVHFLFRNLLDRGVGVTTTVDFLGKNVAEYLRAKWVDLPVRFLNRGKL